MVLQAIQSCLHDIVYEMASTAEPIPFKGAIESLGDVATAISDNSKEVHVQLEQTALLHGKPSNDYTYTTRQYLGNVVRRVIWFVTEACRQYTHLDGQLANLALHTILAPDAATPNWGRGDYPLFQSNGLS